MKAKQILKAGVLIDKKYAVIQRTVFLWFTVIPPADDRTPEQEAAYTEYVTYISEKGWSKYNALKALEARLQVGSEGDPGHEVLGGEEWEEDHDGDPSLGGDVGDDELS